MRGTERKAATLIEVLVAIFIMAIGLLALLVLFPLGALRMSQAIQDERSANAVATADAVAQIYNLRRDALLFTPTDAFVNPVPGNINIPPAAADEPGYPVLIDPPGFYTAGAIANQRDWVGGSIGLIPRRNASFVAGLALPQLQRQAAVRWFSQLDALTYDDNGIAKPVVPGTPPQIERDIRYTWGFLCRRPRSSDTLTDMTVVVYNGRPLTLSAGADLYETVYGIGGIAGTEARFDPSTNVITVVHGGTLPNLRAGDWVLDATPFINYLEPTKKPPVRTARVRHAFFYRVVGVTERAGAVDLEVQTPLRVQTPVWSPNTVNFPPTTLPAGGWSGTLIVMEGVAEVFERGTGQRP